jgi:hypothetical protein
MLIIGENERDLRNFFYGIQLRTVGPVIRMNFILILKFSCSKEKIKWEEFYEIIGLF